MNQIMAKKKIQCCIYINITKKEKNLIHLLIIWCCCKPKAAKDASHY